MANFRGVVKVIIYNAQGNVLVLKRNIDTPVFPGMWDLPGGKIEFGENFQTAITREISEEVKLNTDPMPHPVFGWTGIAYNKDTQFFGYLFIAKYVSGDVVLSPEHTDYKWVNRQEAENLDMHQDFKDIICKFFDKKFNQIY